MRTLGFIFVTATVALVLALPTQAVTSTNLNASVGPGFTISLKDAAGKKVTTLKSGVYTIAVSDKSSSHNFRLTGPGLSWRFTTVPFVGKDTITLTLKPGTYTYVCDPHASAMRGTFKVA